jgi:hypothetical protein
MLRMNFTPTAIEHGIIGWKHCLVSKSIQSFVGNLDSSDGTNLNGGNVPLLNCNRDLPVADDPKVLAASNDKPATTRGWACMTKLGGRRVAPPVLMKRRVPNAARAELCG